MESTVARKRPDAWNLAARWPDWQCGSNALVRYALPVVAVLFAALFLKWLGGLFAVPGVFLIAVVVSALFGGWGPGLVATALATLVFYKVFLPHYFVRDALHLPFVIVPRAIGSFAVGALAVTLLGGAQRRATKSLRLSNSELDRKVRELEGANRVLESEIAERKRIEATLVETARQWRTILDEVGIGFVTLGRDHHFKASNRRFRQMVGYDDDELQNLTPIEITHEDDRRKAEKLWNETLSVPAANDSPQLESDLPHVEMRYRRKDGGLIWVSVIEARIPHGSEDRFVFAIIIDVTERKSTEEGLQLARAELWRLNRIMLLGEMSASIAHEVNQPIAGVVTNASAGQRWLAAEPPDLEEARQALARIVRDGNRAADVIQRVRAAAQKRAGKTERLDINATIREVAALLEAELRKTAIDCDLQLSQSLPGVQADEVQLQQVLLNLVVNAIEAMAGNTGSLRKLTIVTRHDDSGCIAVEVRDTGPGLDADAFDRLFGSFYTTKPEGMGMGLAICRSIIETHGGKISAAPNEPHGAVFRFSLPVGNGALAAEPNARL